MAPGCLYQDKHPEIEVRLRALEEFRHEAEKANLDRWQDLIDRVGEVHEKINGVALRVEEVMGRFLALEGGFRAWKVVIGIALTAGGGVLGFVAARLWEHIAKGGP
jgi:hypothetical protein